MLTVNRVTLLGKVSKPPRIGQTTTGKRVANFYVITHRTFYHEDGSKSLKDECHRIVAWGSLVAVVEKRVSDGDMIYVEGELSSRDRKDASGNLVRMLELIATSIVALGPHHQP